MGVIDIDVRDRILNLSEYQFHSLFWQVYGAMDRLNPGQIDNAILACLPGIEARRVI